MATITKITTHTYRDGRQAVLVHFDDSTSQEYPGSPAEFRELIQRQAELLRNEAAIVLAIEAGLTEADLARNPAIGKELTLEVRQEEKP